MSHKAPKLTDVQIRTLGRRYIGGESARALAKEVGIGHTTFSKWMARHGFKLSPQEVDARKGGPGVFRGGGGIVDYEKSHAAW